MSSSRTHLLLSFLALLALLFGSGCPRARDSSASQAAKDTAPTTNTTGSPVQRDDPKAVELLDDLVKAQPLAIVAKDDSGCVRSASLALSRITDEDLELLKGLPKLKKLGVGGTRVTDKGLVHLRDMKQLEEVRLANDDVSDAGLEHVAGLGNLRVLDLFMLYGDGSKITDSGMRHLSKLTNLEELNLTHTYVSDVSIEILTNLKKLKDLRLSGTRFTKEGVAKLVRALPECEIDY